MIRFVTASQSAASVDLVESPTEQFARLRRAWDNEADPISRPLRHMMNVFFLTHSWPIGVDSFRADGSGAHFEGDALDAAEAVRRFVEEGGVGDEVVADDLAPGVADTNRVCDWEKSRLTNRKRVGAGSGCSVGDPCRDMPAYHRLVDGSNLNRAGRSVTRTNDRGIARR